MPFTPFPLLQLEPGFADERSHPAQAAVLRRLLLKLAFELPTAMSLLRYLASCMPDAETFTSKMLSLNAHAAQLAAMAHPGSRGLRAADKGLELYLLIVLDVVKKLRTWLYSHYALAALYADMRRKTVRLRLGLAFKVALAQHAKKPVLDRDITFSSPEVNIHAMPVTLPAESDERWLGALVRMIELHSIWASKMRLFTQAVTNPWPAGHPAAGGRADDESSMGSSPPAALMTARAAGRYGLVLEA